MSLNPEYPVALIGDDSVPVVYRSFNKLTQAVEPQDISDYRIVDASGAVFRIRIKDENSDSLLNKFLSMIGAPERYEIEPAPDQLPKDVIARAKLVLLGQATSPRSLG